MNAVDLEVLEACHEATRCRHEMLPRLAAALEVPDAEVFYTWAFRRCPQHGRLADPAWAFFFHGLECDLQNTEDGRFLRLDFGPGGTVETFTAWGVLQFIMTSVSPWPEFSTLRARFASGGPPYDQYAGDFTRFCEVWDGLDRQGCFEFADKRLLRFREEHSTIGPDGITYVEYPDTIDPKTPIDCAVANRVRLSEHGRKFLHQHLTRDQA